MTGDVKHQYHLANPSPWPVVTSIALLILAVGGVGYMKGVFGIPQGNLLVLAPGLLALVYALTGWWSEIVSESRRGEHKEVAGISFRMGMVLFILSEVMFFVGWFWAFFEMAIYYDLRAGNLFDTEQYELLEEWKTWPPMQTDGHRVETFDPFGLPLINTLVLLLSGTTVTWSHHSLQNGDRRGAIAGLVLTIALGVLFTILQAVEYSHAHFSYDGSLYGSAFFMATGFHGAHVVIGTLFLAVCLLRLLQGDFTPKKHLGFEFAAWYWHFVDVVWLFLFAFVYVTPRLALGA